MPIKYYMKTYSQRHNAEQAVTSALKRLNLLEVQGISYIFVMRSDNRLQPVVYLDPLEMKVDPAEKIMLSNLGFTVMIGSVPQELVE